MGKLYDASLGACAPASTVDNWCNAPNSVNNQPIREEYPGSDPIRGLDSVNYGPGTSDYDSGSNIVLEMSGDLHTENILDLIIESQILVLRQSVDKMGYFLTWILTVRSIMFAMDRW